MMFTHGFRFSIAYAIDVIPFFISAGLSLSRLFVPQCITTDSTFTGISPFCILHNTCWVLSPLIPKFKALTGSNNSDQTLRYLQSPFMMESPIRTMVDLDSVAIDTKLLC